MPRDALPPLVDSCSTCFCSGGVRVPLSSPPPVLPPSRDWLISRLLMPGSQVSGNISENRQRRACVWNLDLHWLLLFSLFAAQLRPWVHMLSALGAPWWLCQLSPRA